MLLQVKTMSSHQELAGTRQWKRIVSSLGRCRRIATANTSPQSGQDVSKSAVEESLRLFATAASPSRGYLTRWSAVSS
jgi:hypothetical protein